MTASMKWWEGPAVGFDIESTGIDAHNDRIVTATAVYALPNTRPRAVNWLIDPGIPIPDEAAAVHGWTNERLAEQLAGAQAARIVNGESRPLPKAAALEEIALHVTGAMAKDVPLVAMNAAYDCTMLNSELLRHNLRSLLQRTPLTGVVDPAVLEKQWDPYRKVNRDGGCRGGKHACGGCGATNKTLAGLCAHYGIVLAEAHTSAADALAAVRLARRLAGLWPDVARLKLSTLHEKQVGWRATQMDGLRSYFDKNGIEHDGCDPSWPLLSASAKAVA